MELSQLVKRFDEAEEAGQTAREEAAEAHRYYAGKQADTELKRGEEEDPKHLDTVKRAFNRVRRKVDWLRGLELQSRTDPRAYPRTPQRQQAASAATDALRFAADQADWDKARTKAWRNLLLAGWCGIEILHEPSTVGPDGKERPPRIITNAYSYDRLFFDPYSMEEDFSDARYKGAFVWENDEDLIAAFPDKEMEIKGSYGEDGVGTGTFADKPSHLKWCDPERKRVRVVMMYYQEGGAWHWAQFVRGGILAQGAVEYVDEYGKSICPLELGSAYIDEDNLRHGVVRDMFAPQDEINHRRHRGKRLLDERQTMALEGAIPSISQLKRELKKADGHVTVAAEAVEAAAQVGMKPFEILPTSDMAQGNLAMLQESKQEIDMMGANSGLAGKGEGNSQSGRAIMAKQQGGLIEIAPLTEQLSDLTRRVYRQIWMRIRQFWTAEHWVRVTDDDKVPRFVVLNHPVTLREKLIELPDQEAQQMAAQYSIQSLQDPRLDVVVEVSNSVAEMDVDILIEEAPDVVSLMGETFEQMVSVAPFFEGGLPPELIIEMLPNMRRDVKDKMLEAIKARQAANAQAAQAQAQAAEMQNQIKASVETAKAGKLNADAAETMQRVQFSHDAWQKQQQQAAALAMVQKALASQQVPQNVEAQRLDLYGA